MPDTQSYSSQAPAPRIVSWDDRTCWENRSLARHLGEVGRTSNERPPTTHWTQPLATDSPVDQTPGTNADWRAELKARYRAMPRTSWFKAAHEDRPLGGSVKIIS